MTNKERIELILINYKIPTAEELGRVIGVDGEIIRNLIRGRTKKMSGKVADAILEFNLSVMLTNLANNSCKVCKIKSSKRNGTGRKRRNNRGVAQLGAHLHGVRYLFDSQTLTRSANQNNIKGHWSAVGVKRA